MYSPYSSKPRDTKMPENKSQTPKTEYFRSSLKSKEDLAFLKYRDQQNSKQDPRMRETLNKPDTSKFISHTTKHEEKQSNNFFKAEDYQWRKNASNQFSLNRSAEKRLGSNQYSPTHNDRKQFLENIKPETSEYQKLHDKLNYLETKITEMRSNLEKKREEKKKYFEKEVKERKELLEGDWNRNSTSPHQKADPLKELVSQVSYEKKFKPLAFDPYSPRHNIYYVSEIVRAYKEENSLAREHLVNSIHLLKMLARSRLPTREDLNSRTVKLPKNPYYQDKKTVIFDLDETLIHCNENVNVPYDVKLPIKFPTGEIIQAGINIRPHAVDIIKNLSKKFEVIVFTASHSCYANVVLDHLDPENKYIAHRLFREHCFPTNEGVYVKDLRVVNRDLSQTILIDNAAYSYAFQIDNGIPIIPYYEGKVDFELKALQGYIESMSLAKDVRDINRNTFKLSRYTEFDTPESLVKSLYHNELK